jgi:hypothetical protein
MVATPRTLAITPTRLSSQPAGKPVANYSSRAKDSLPGMLTTDAATVASEISTSSCTFAEWPA